MARVVVVADPCIYRESLAEALCARPDIDGVGVAAGDGGLRSIMDEVSPEAVLVDYGMAGSLSAIRRIADEYGGIQVVAFCVPDGEQEILSCFEAGAAAYVPHGGSIENLLNVVSGALRGELRVRPRVAAMLSRRVARLADTRASGASSSSLTLRELEIVELIDQGLSNKEIARRLGIRIATVKNHVHNILEKLHVNRRGEAAALVRGRLSSSAAGGAARSRASLNPSD